MRVATIIMFVITAVVMVNVMTDVRKGQMGRFHGTEAEHAIRYQQEPDAASG